jgi:hypothetical protein
MEQRSLTAGRLQKQQWRFPELQITTGDIISAHQRLNPNP